MCDKLDIQMDTNLEEVIEDYLKKATDRYVDAVMVVLDKVLEPLGFKFDHNAGYEAGYGAAYQKDGGDTNLFINYFGDGTIHGTLYTPSCEDGEDIGFSDNSEIKTIREFVEELKIVMAE